MTTPASLATRAEELGGRARGSARRDRRASRLRAGRSTACERAPAGRRSARLLGRFADACRPPFPGSRTRSSRRTSARARGESSLARLHKPRSVQMTSGVCLTRPERAELLLMRAGPRRGRCTRGRPGACRSPAASGSPRATPPARHPRLRAGRAPAPRRRALAARARSSCLRLGGGSGGGRRRRRAGRLAERVGRQGSAARIGFGAARGRLRLAGRRQPGLAACGSSWMSVPEVVHLFQLVGGDAAPAGVDRRDLRHGVEQQLARRRHVLLLLGAARARRRPSALRCRAPRALSRSARRARRSSVAMRACARSRSPCAASFLASSSAARRDRARAAAAVRWARRGRRARPI